MDDKFEEAVSRNPHLREYIENYKKESGITPDFVTKLSRDIVDIPVPSIIYPVGDPVFIHIKGDKSTREIRYIAVEPVLSTEEQKKYNQIMDSILEKAADEIVPENEEQLRKLMVALLNDSVQIEGKTAHTGFMDKLLGERPVPLSHEEYDKISYYLDRDIIGQGPIEAVIRDPYLEDIHSIGVNGIYIVHKILGMLTTSLTFGTQENLSHWLHSMGERIGRPVSDARPIIDGTLPDGTRINAIYSTDVSRKGSSFTLRKFMEIPASIPQLIKWGSIDANMASYIWLLLENQMSIFFSGETASGKTTMLNAALPFISRKAKMYSVENTAEVAPPQAAWQQLITREDGPKESQVDTFTLLKVALRSRPNYIIVGEIRGEEGAVAFQAMQTGHAVLATFHASSVKKLIQRLTGEPINIPATFVDNLNAALILQAIYRKGKFLRRCTSVEEIEGYLEEAGGVITRAVFEWDFTTDRHRFRGMNNSFILDRVAIRLGHSDKRMIYDELSLRAKILSRMVEENILDYYKVRDIIWGYQAKGLEGIPFEV
ncbi:ATPase, type IV secretory pathway VirB11 component like protein [Candidatus Methanoperedens nitroreducens]|uniref:ATPase, type IV secretory pathway VirB11 component like protein n=1 Tax=Candidatus Methanoperedens nitratireducens TaxID=1392998 RepID=A0A062V171_9EURY|nr:type II/IV secretion system ATPase subunit [Candidatus Methanoperedens nitroreducens]KCZ71132.1 ATPase, type IV secretory pathway VirB11 component like protein [Candidatus Methanoperedens nitroreducens]MDJ1421490.1 type II/IV secretion system ATPase subunit [Candidatus Methanoperedens sp.]